MVKIRLYGRKGDLELVEVEDDEGVLEGQYGIMVYRKPKAERRTLFPWNTIHSVTWGADEE